MFSCYARRIAKPAGAGAGAVAVATAAFISSWEGKVVAQRTSQAATQPWLAAAATTASSRLQRLQQQLQPQQQRRFSVRNKYNYSNPMTTATRTSTTTTRLFTSSKEPLKVSATEAATKLPEVGVSSSSSISGGGFLAWYEGHLQARPVATKMVSGSLLWGIGDAVAQIVPHAAAGTPLPDYDWMRTGRATFFGFAIHAPLSHLHFNFLEWITVRSGVTGLRIPFFKAFLEQFVYWSWFSNSLYHGAMGAMQGLGPQQIYDRIADVLWDTQKAQWVFWIPIQLINFQLTPVRHQLNVVLLTSIVWTALLSAWYPPAKQDDEEASLVQEGAEKP